MISSKKNEFQLEHAPNLNTVIMVENVLKEQATLKISELKKILPRQVNHNTLKTILEYLEESNKIAVSIKGITWIHSQNPVLKNAISKGFEL